jgi:Flp pilus assembly protein TadG
MRRYLWRWLGARGGTATLEFALLGSSFVLLVFFLLGMSLLLWAKGAMQMAASRTARCTAIGSSACASPQAYAASLISAWGTAGIVPSISVTVQSGTTCNSTAGHFSMVTISSTGASGGFVASLSGIILTSSACYPSGT